MVPEKEYVRFGAWPLQVLPDATALVAEAIREAAVVEFEGVPARVFRAEYVCAVALQTGRIKDLLRVDMFLQQSKVSYENLLRLAHRFDLGDMLAKAEGLNDGSR